jgi:hypothetical protein
MSGASLTAAINSLFNSDGSLNGATNTASLHIYNGETYLIITDDVANTDILGASDIVVRVTGFTGTLDTWDFI